MVAPEPSYQKDVYAGLLLYHWKPCNARSADLGSVPGIDKAVGQSTSLFNNKQAKASACEQIANKREGGNYCASHRPANSLCTFESPSLKLHSVVYVAGITGGLLFFRWIPAPYLNYSMYTSQATHFASEENYNAAPDVVFAENCEQHLIRPCQAQVNLTSVLFSFSLMKKNIN